MDAGQKTDRPPEQIVREVVICSHAWHALLGHVLKCAAHVDSVSVCVLSALITALSKLNTSPLTAS